MARTYRVPGPAELTMPRTRAPELNFQQHVADFLVRVHGYGVLEQAEITDSEHCIAEDQLWAFLQATQAEQLRTLADDYSSDAREEVFRALRRELEYTPLWMIPAPRPESARAGVPPLLPETPLGRERRSGQTRPKPPHLSSALLFWRDAAGDRLRRLPQRPADRRAGTEAREKPDGTRRGRPVRRARPRAAHLPAPVPVPGRRYQRRDGGDRPTPGGKLPLAQTAA
jgi:hypothetical protein